MTEITLNFTDDELEILNEYIKVNKISMEDLPAILTNFLIDELSV